MKIGIVTIFDSENLGNQLQTYALHQVLGNWAEEVVTIKNKPRFDSLGEWVRRGTPLAESVFLNRLLGKRRKARILEFQKQYLPTTRHSYCCGKTYATLRKKDQCDGYCAGSDQVWNPELGRTGGFSFLTFAGDRGFSYAASFGIGSIPETHRENMGRWLREIPYLSLREDAGAKIVMDLTDRTDALVLPDPTLLLSREEWDKIAGKPKAVLPERYILLYFLGNVPPDCRAAISEQAAEQNLAVVDLMDRGSPWYAIGPGEFLCLIREANCVFTDSFHGSIFSFLYQRPLQIFRREGNMGSRMDTLCKKLYLEHCLVKEVTIPTCADYSAGQSALEEWKDEAMGYLQKVFAREQRKQP